MVQTDLSFTLSVLVPIMFVLVFETAGKARTLDLYELLPSEDPRPRTGWEASVAALLTRLLPGVERGQHIPRFGHFNSLYAVSRVILLYGAGLVGYGLDGDARFVLGISIFVMLGVLPLIEIDEYRHIDNRSTVPRSVRIHAVGYLIPFLFIYALGQALARSVPFPVVILLGLVFVLIPSVIVTVYFSTTLERELRENQPKLT
jgi:hypothetical protein